MRKVVFQMLVSLDGYYEGPDHGIDWHNVDAEFNEYAIDNLRNKFDTLLFGRVTYEGMAAWWPTPAAATDDPIVANLMNTLPKIVFSRTLDRAEWQNTRLVKEHAAEEVARLKQQPGKDIAIFGSSDLALALIPHGLIDEYHILVNPIVLGGGKALFHGIQGRLKLKLLRTQTYRSGNVLLVYGPA